MNTSCLTTVSREGLGRGTARGEVRVELWTVLCEISLCKRTTKMRFNKQLLVFLLIKPSVSYDLWGQVSEFHVYLPCLNVSLAFLIVKELAFNKEEDLVGTVKLRKVPLTALEVRVRGFVTVLLNLCCFWANGISFRWLKSVRKLTWRIAVTVNCCDDVGDCARAGPGDVIRSASELSCPAGCSCRDAGCCIPASALHRDHLYHISPQEEETIVLITQT